MKINKLTNSIKRAFLAFALTSLSFSSASALDIVLNFGEDYDGADIIEANGSIQYLANGANVDFSSSYLGNSLGGRWSIYSVTNPMLNPSNLNLSDTTMYVSDFSVGNYFNLNLRDHSFFYADNAIVFGSGCATNISNSTLKAPSLTTGKLLLENNAYGEFAANVSGTMILSNSKWVSLGSSTIGFGNIQGGNNTLGLIMSSATDAIHFVNGIFGGATNFDVNFTDDFIGSIFADTGYYDLDINNTITFSGGSMEYTFAINPNIATSNGTYTWNVTDLGGSVFRISEITVIPEPSTYAAIFGLIALAFVAYRKRR